jgi:hypothetical protein
MKVAELALEDPIQSFDTSQINKMLWNRYTEKGEHVFLFDVPNIVGLNSSRRCDGVAVGMWQSSGRLIQGFEVKASRSDWLREVKDVTKADPFIEQCDRWWLVTGHISIAKPEEIPESWGWMVATKTGLRIQRPAKPLPQTDVVIKRLWAFALIRRAAERSDPNSTEFQVMLKKATDEAMQREKERADREIARAQPAYDALRKKVETFERESGMKLEDWRLGNVGRLARRLTSLDNYSSASTTLKRLIQGLDSLKANAKGVLEALDCPALTGEDEE